MARRDEILTCVERCDERLIQPLLENGKSLQSMGLALLNLYRDCLQSMGLVLLIP